MNTHQQFDCFEKDDKIIIVTIYHDEFGVTVFCYNHTEKERAKEIADNIYKTLKIEAPLTNPSPSY